MNLSRFTIRPKVYRHKCTRLASMVITTLACSALIIVLPLAENAAGGAQEPDAESISNYCGVQCLYRAMLSLEITVTYEALVNPMYIGSKEGSSLTELSKAARDHGLYTLPVYHAVNMLLYSIQDPFLLHTKSKPGRDRFDHWVLFMGLEDGKARICDGWAKVKLVEFDQLAELWDGSGLIVSQSADSDVHRISSVVTNVHALF